jgi:hypothetical protein
LPADQKVTVLLDRHDRDALYALAADEDRPVSYVVRRAVRDVIREHGYEAQTVVCEPLPSLPRPTHARRRASTLARSS